MTSLVENAIIKAREDFEIQNFPGNLFNVISGSVDDIEKYKILVIKKNLDKNDGFISYEGDFTYIGVNQIHPIGRQNFTLAHELGHKYIHLNESFDDKEKDVFSSNQKEREASDFAAELLYPKCNFEEDYKIMVDNGMFFKKNISDFAIYIDELCHRYCMSFDAILRKVFSNRMSSYVDNALIKKIKKDIDAALGKKYTHLDKNFHISNESTYNCENEVVNGYLKTLVSKAVQSHEIGKATGDSILFSHGLLEDDE